MDKKSVTLLASYGREYKHVAGEVNMTKKAVLFDCDGVLINTEEIGYKILSKMLDDELVKHGHKPPMYSREKYVEILSGITYPQFVDRMQDDFKLLTGKKLSKSFFQTLGKKIAAAEDTEMKAIDGVKTLLSSLKSSSIPFAVASNSGATGLERKLKKAGLYDFFKPHIYSRDDVKNEKPAPDMFLLASQKIGGFSPDECIVIEDSVTGAKAGVAAGMYVIGFVGEQHRIDQEEAHLKNAGVSSIAYGMDEVLTEVFNLAGKPLPKQISSSSLKPKGPKGP